MHKEIFTPLTGLPLTTSSNIDHNTINFVDDYTNIISTPNVPEIQDYINKLYTLLELVYNTNKLIFNKDKTELMVICKNIYRKLTKNIQMYAS